MTPSSAERNPVELLAEEFADRLRRGETPSLSEYLEKYPQHAKQIRKLFPALVMMEQFKPAAGDLTGDHVSAGPEEAQPPECLGDYRIVRMVGQGGMGVVYEAEQLSLGRHVALKVLPSAALLPPTFLERFQREAKAAARLHHTNIVPVFGVGESNGIHFYAMQFIHGQGLDKVLADVRRLRQQPVNAVPAEASVAQSLLTGRFMPPTTAALEEPVGHISPLAPTSVGEPHSSSALSAGGPEGEYCRGVARIGVQAADALAYAHRQGIFHRDIKPSNLLLDLQGTIWITDFGLAKAEGTDDLTHPGDIVGTIRYMAPERFDGLSLPQSDVYALGLTLYEMLTLRPAYDDPNKAKLIERILHEPPTPPRQLEPRITRDLETVVLKCLAKDPSERYATAEALTEDLRRFLTDRPIRARRSSALERGWRWCRRNPTVATLTGVVLLLLTITAVGGVAMSLGLKEALGQAEEERDKARGAESAGKVKLFESTVSEANAIRLSRQMGQRFGCLGRIREALAIGREIGLSDKDRLRLRNIAIAALCLPDVERMLQRSAGPDKTLPEDLDPVIQQLVQARDAIERLPPPAYWMGESSFSSDGRFLVVATADYSALNPSPPVWVWRIDEPEPKCVLKLPESPSAMTFRSDNRQVAFGFADESVIIYDTATWQPVRRLERGQGRSLSTTHDCRDWRSAIGRRSPFGTWRPDSVSFRSPSRRRSAWLPGTRMATVWPPVAASRSTSGMRRLGSLLQSPGVAIGQRASNSRSIMPATGS